VAVALAELPEFQLQEQVVQAVVEQVERLAHLQAE
jgi:hypothetical protein